MERRQVTKAARKKMDREWGFNTTDDVMITMVGWKLVLDIEEWLGDRERTNDPA